MTAELERGDSDFGLPDPIERNACNQDVSGSLVACMIVPVMSVA